VNGHDGRLGGRRCLVVGAGSGIGRAVARAFVAEGAAVGAMEIDPAKGAALEADGITVSVGDAAAVDDTRRAAERAVAELGGLDVLVNCVGVFDFRRGLGDLSADELDAGFDEAFRVNVKSHLLSVHASLPALREARGTVILTLSSSAFRPEGGGILYVASKFALRGAVVSLARELAPDVRVNGVAPGGTAGTDLRGLRSLGQQDRALGAGPDREADLRARSALEVVLGPDDIAASFVFLASDGAKGMTGRFLHPDGGAAVLR